jgi:multiple sugar transport system ATP-binding protein
MAQVLLKNLNKKYDEVHAVKDVNLHIRDKEFMVLVGPSGCGKSTTLRMVAGREEITGGEIVIGERVVNDLPPKDRDIAMVFQNYALYPHMTVYDNMAFGLKMRKFPKAEIQKRVQDAAEILGIQELLKRKPRQLSGGQRQRVAVGRAIVRHPQVFLFDEPLSNLDAKLRVQMRVELKRLHDRLETTAIYVTHDQVEAMTLGDRVVVMKDGWIQQVGAELGVEVRQGLVEQEHGWLAHDRATHGHALSLSARELLRQPGQLVGESKHIGRLAHALIDLALRQLAEL